MTPESQTKNQENKIEWKHLELYSLPSDNAIFLCQIMLISPEFKEVITF